MKRRDPQSLKEIIDIIMDDDSVREAARAQRLCYLWPEVVGPGINAYTTRRYVDGRTLHVFISSGPLKNELQFNRTRLIDLLNNAVGCQVIDDIHFH